MESWMAGLARGTQAAASKYGDIKDEQRKFNSDQTKLAAADMRKRNFAKFDYAEKDSYAPSGQVQDDRELNKREAALTPPEGTTRQSKAEYDAQIKAEAAGKVEDKRIAVRDEKRVYQEGLQAEKDKKAGIKAEKKATTAEVKADKGNFRKDFNKRVEGVAAGTDPDVAELEARIRTLSDYPYEHIQSIPANAQASFMMKRIDKVTADAAAGKMDEKQAIEWLNSQLPKAQAEVAVKKLEQDEVFGKGLWDRVSGFFN